MTDAHIGVTAYQVGSEHPSTRYGQPALLRLATSSGQPGWQALLRASLAGIPDSATIASATLRFFQHSDIAAHNFDLRRNTSPWDSRVTWADRPTYSDPVVSVVSAGAGVHAAIDFDVTATVQQIVAGTLTDRGWLLSRTDDGVPIGLEGTPSDGFPPVLLVSYTLTAQVPDNLSPTGIVSIDKPVLTFDVDYDVLSIQVQVDPTGNETAPAFDSGEVASTGGSLDLSTTTYAGLADGATTQWRSRQKNALGWGDWSEWTDFSRVAKKTLTITAPATGSIADGTPPIAWSFAGTQSAWRVRLLNVANTALDDSGRTVGTTAEWASDSGFTKDGQRGTIRVDVWDDVDREATPGDPVYITALLPITLDLDATVAPMDTLVAVVS